MATENHQDSRAHIQAIMQHNALQRNSEILNKRTLTEMEMGVTVAVEAAYWVVNENLPIVKFESLMNLMRSQNMNKQSLHQ